MAIVVSYYAAPTSCLPGTVNPTGKQALLSELQRGAFNYAQGIFLFFPPAPLRKWLPPSWQPGYTGLPAKQHIPLKTAWTKLQKALQAMSRNPDSVTALLGQPQQAAQIRSCAALSNGDNFQLTLQGFRNSRRKSWGIFPFITKDYRWQQLVMWNAVSSRNWSYLLIIS